MKRKLVAFGMRLLIAGALSVVVGVTAVMPAVPRVLWPAISALFYPVLWFWKIMGQSDLLFLPHASLGRTAYDLARLALPVYVAISYLPQFGWWVGKRVHKVTRACLQMPKEFTLYFLVGAVFGSLLGVFAGLEGGLLWPEWGMLSCVLVTATVSGWSLAVLRCRPGMEA